MSRNIISVVGLGKLGLPLAVYFSSKADFVFGVDVNEKLVSTVNEGEEPFPGEEGLGTRLSSSIAEEKFRATCNYAEAVRASNVVVVVVPLLVSPDASPNFENLDASTQSIAAEIQPGTLVIYETTLPVGTTRNRIKPILEDGSGLKEGEDFFLVFSPERVLTGRVFRDLERYPKLVGALSDEGESRAVKFYEEIISFQPRADLSKPNGVWRLDSAEAAEFAKLAETTYRDVNIGLANEFARNASNLGISFSQIAEACNSQPYSHLHTPGISVGGHCIPVYPRLYLSGNVHAPIVLAARQSNEMMPKFAVGLAEKMVGDLRNQAVLILGVSYRPGAKEAAFSGAFALQQELHDRGASVTATDPLYSNEELLVMGFKPWTPNQEVNVVILHTAHHDFLKSTSEDFPGVRYLIDGRGEIDKSRWRGVEIAVIGEGH